MGAGDIDWNAAWQAARERSGRIGGRAGVWDQRAPGFARSAGRSGYVERVLDVVAPERDWTVLDVGCGSGTLAVPLARRVREVVALDFSSRMLDLLRERCAAERIDNVRPVLGAWEDDWDALGIPACDVAIASRSLTVHDLRAALLKLNRAARRKAIAVAPAGAHPANGRVVEAAGRPHAPGPDYLYPYALLHQLGIYAAVELIPVPDARRFASVDDALEGILWMIPDPTPEEVGRLRSWLERELVPGPEGLVLASARPVQWAVISWSTDAAATPAE